MILYGIVWCVCVHLSECVCMLTSKVSVCASVRWVGVVCVYVHTCEKCVCLCVYV